MGQLLQAVCKCGYESDGIMAGVGFSFGMEGIFYLPAYCDHCGTIEAKDGRDKEPVCEHCKKSMQFYWKEGSKSASFNKLGLPESDYLEKKNDWHCPVCKQQALRFYSTGLWD